MNVNCFLDAVNHSVDEEQILQKVFISNK